MIPASQHVGGVVYRQFVIVIEYIDNCSYFEDQEKQRTERSNSRHVEFRKPNPNFCRRFTKRLESR